MDSPFPVNFNANIDTAISYMKVLANSHRLIVMCHITEQPRCVSELVALTGMSQPALSHQLARLRDEEMVATQRKGKEIYYRIANRQLASLVESICYQFQCWREVR